MNRIQCNNLGSKLDLDAASLELAYKIVTNCDNTQATELYWGNVQPERHPREQAAAIITPLC